jgi:hypothetical protein
MSPLQIRIMLHYSYSAVGWEEESDAAVIAIGDFIHNGMLGYGEIFTPKHFITEKGKAYVDKLCSIPIPVETTTYSFPVENGE